MRPSAILFPFWYFLNSQDAMSTNRTMPGGWADRQDPPKGRKRPQSLPLVQSGSSQGPRDILFGLVRGRMASAQRPRLHSRKGSGTRSRRLRCLRCRLPGCGTATQTTSGRGPLESFSRLGSGLQKNSLGRRPHYSGRRRRRGMRSPEYPHLMPEVPSRSHRPTPAAPPQLRFYRSNGFRYCITVFATISLPCAVGCIPSCCIRSGCSRNSFQ